MLQKYKKMKHLTTLCGIIAAFLCLAQNANAQYLPGQIHREKAAFVDEHGRELSDSELIDAIGADVFEQTVVGARKQYKAGRSLLISGIASMGVGMAGMLGGAALIGSAGPHENANHQYYFDDEQKAATGGAFVLIGSLVTALGGTALSAGIPLKSIGQSRLNWVENDYNERRGHALHVGATPNGIGLALKF